MRALAAVLAVAAIAGCLRDPTACDDGRLCPAGTVCHGGGCATEEQIAACAGLAADAACTTSQIGLGVCVGGACVAQTCGNAHLDPAESCEGTMLRETTCAAIFAGYDGTLACTDTCTYDTSGCAGSCGDTIVNGPETCDGPIDDPSCLAEDRDFGLVACTACNRSLAGCRSFGWSRELPADARLAAAVGPETLAVYDGTLALLDLATGDLTAIATPDFFPQGAAVTASGTIVIPGLQVNCGGMICSNDPATWVGTADGLGMLHPATGAAVASPVAVGDEVYATSGGSGEIYRWVATQWVVESIVDPVLGAARGPIATDGATLYATLAPTPSVRIVRRTGPATLELVGTVPNAHLLAVLPGGDVVAGTNQAQSWRVSGGVTTTLDYGRDAIGTVSALRATPDGKVLAATQVGTAMLEGIRWTYLDSGITYDATTTPDGAIFAGRPSGLWRLLPDRWQKLGHAPQGSIAVDHPWPTQPAYLVGGVESVVLIPNRVAAPADGQIACATPVARYFYLGFEYRRCVGTACANQAGTSPGPIACDPSRDRLYFGQNTELLVIDDGVIAAVPSTGLPRSISVVAGAGALIASYQQADTFGVIERYVDGAPVTVVLPGPVDAQGQPVEDPFTAIHACTLDDWFVATRGHVYRQANGVTTAWTLPENETIARIVAAPDCSVVYAQSQQTLFRYTTTDPRWIPIRAPGTGAMNGIVYTDEGPIVSGQDGVSLLVLAD